MRRVFWSVGKVGVNDCDVLFVFSRLSQLRGTAMGDVIHVLEQAEFIQDCTSDACKSGLRDLFPMCLSVVRGHLSGLFEAKLECILGTVKGLNFMFVAGWSSQPMLPTSQACLTLVQVASVKHIARVVEYFFCKPPVPCSSDAEATFLQERKVVYDGSGVSVRRPLVVSRVFLVWVDLGQACVVCINEVVDEHSKDEM